METFTVCDKEEANYLLYRGILFDDFTISEYGIWAVICEECYKKYKDNIDKSELDDTGEGICSVRGCSNNGNEEDVKNHYYIDFNEKEIIWLKEKKEA